MINRHRLRRLINEEIAKRKRRARMRELLTPVDNNVDLRSNLIKKTAKKTLYVLLGISAVLSPVILLVSYLKKSA